MVISNSPRLAHESSYPLWSSRGVHGVSGIWLPQSDNSRRPAHLLSPTLSQKTYHQPEAKPYFHFYERSQREKVRHKGIFSRELTPEPCWLWFCSYPCDCSTVSVSCPLTMCDMHPGSSFSYPHCAGCHQEYLVWPLPTGLLHVYSP